MNIKTVKLRGFIGIKKGLGLDEISLDLSGVSGLVALAGPNGHGKTTLLDNLHPFPCLGSRDKALSHHVFLRDSERDLTFDHDGVEYRTQIKIDSESGKTEGFIWANGESLVDGKITSYKKKIEDIFGSQTLFFESVFCAQNATKLSDMRTGLLRDLFAEFLRLDELQEKHLTAKQIKNIMIGKVTDKDIQIAKLQDSCSEYEHVSSQIKALSTEIEQRSKDINHFQNKIEQSEIMIDELKTAYQKNETHRTKVKELEDKRQSITDMHKSEVSRIETDLEGLREKYKGLSADRANNLDVMAKKDKIKDAVKVVKFNTEQIESLNGKIDKSREKLQELKDGAAHLDREMLTLINQQKGYYSNPEISSLTDKLKHLNRAAADLDKRDDSCQSKTCPFIASAVEALEQIPTIKADLQKAISKNEEDIKDNETAQKALNETIDTMSSRIKALETDINVMVSTRQDHSIKVSEAQDLASQINDIEVAENNVNRLEKLMEENKDEGLKAKANLDNTKEIFNKQISGIDADLKEAQAMIKDEVTSHKIDAYNVEILNKKGELKDKQEQLKAKELELNTNTAKLEEISKAKEELDKLNAEKGELSKEVEEWAWLTTALSKDRLQALEIAGAAPTITGYANQLLSSAFGPQTMVKLQTQDENGKEVLNIQVVDEDGEDVTLSNRSGGQQVWALKALRLAMAMLSKEKSGRNFKTILTDEEDGALDSEKAVMFIHLYRAFMEHGGFDSCFYISHKPECVDMADHVLEFSKGGIEIS